MRTASGSMASIRELDWVSVNQYISVRQTSMSRLSTLTAGAGGFSLSAALFICKKLDLDL